LTEQSAQPESDRQSGQPEALGLRAMVIKRQRQIRHRLILSLVGGLAILAAIGLTVFKSWHSAQLEASRISRPPSLDSTPAGRQLVESPRYKQTLDIVNQRDAKAAAKQGDSFVATPDEALRDIDQQPKTQLPFRKPVAPANQPVMNEGPQERQQTERATRPPAATDYARIQQLAGLIASQASLYQKAWQPDGSSNIIILNQDLYQSPLQRSQRWREYQQDSGLRSRNLAAASAINAGQLSFARIINSTDSDTAGPVIAEIAKQGPLYRARLIGSVKENATRNALVIEFDQLIFADGTQTAISAYAVDASRAALGVKSAIDHRYLLRYAPMMAAAFIEGLGSTLSNSGNRLLFGPQYAIATQDAPQLQQGLYAGAGKVGQRMAQDLEGVAPRGPLVKLAAGSLIGVLFLETVPLANTVPSRPEAATP